MGPRQGSPAAETHKKVAPFPSTQRWRGKVFLFALGLIALLDPEGGWAASVDDTHTITVVIVQSALSITDDTGNFSLALSNGNAGSESAARMVNYRVQGNTLPTGALEGVISARIGQEIQGIELQGDVGTFVNTGTPGNIVLQENRPGYQAIGAVPVSLANKGATSGTQATIVNGTLPIAWKAVAREDLPASEQILSLTITLKDA